VEKVIQKAPGDQTKPIGIDALIEAAPDSSPEPTPSPAPMLNPEPVGKEEKKTEEPPKNDFHDDPLIKAALEVFKGRLIT
jgi:hypothetical protein